MVGFITSSSTPSSESRQNALLAGETYTTNPLDQLSSADIAVHIARSTSLEEVPSVTNTADSHRSKLAITADEQVVNKPQVIAASLPSRKDIKKYVTQEGDTITSIAQKFGVTSDSIRWTNGLSGDRVLSGKELTIPPVNGIVYTVKAGDTPESLAEKYRANKDQIIAVNDAEVSGLVVGTEIVIPDAIQPASRMPVSSFAWGGVNPVYSANGYDYGWCTWHAANRRRETGNPIPSNLGNAITWYPIARSMGLPTGNQPRAGAVLWQTGTHVLGHVAFVEKVNEDGSALVSDMNFPYWGRVTYRTVSAQEASNYRYIY